MENKETNFMPHAVIKLLNNISFATAGTKGQTELLENNVIVNLDEISDKITLLHNMVQKEYDEFESQHKSESDETQVLLNNRFTKVDNELINIKDAINSLKTELSNKLTTVNTSINNNTTAVNNMKDAIVSAINNMKSSNDSKNDAIISALNGLVNKVNNNTNNINNLDNRIDALENK